MSEKAKVLTAGLLSLIVTVGVARFAYTPLLPIMQSQTWLDEANGGYLAAVNYLGYMLGALIAARVSSLTLKDQLYRVYLLVAVLSTVAMALTDVLEWWLVFRFVAGVSSSGGLLLASGLILNWLLRHQYRSELGIHFAGVGGGIFVAGLLVELFLALNLSWQAQWWAFGIFAALASVLAWCWMPKPESAESLATGVKLQDRPPSNAYFWVLFAAYFCAGYGYVITATFIVDIVEQQPSLQGLGPWVFVVLGCAAMPAVVVWDVIARRVGDVNALLLIYVIQVPGILLPAFTDQLLWVLVSALLFGGTFIGAVSLVLTMAGRFYPTKPAKLMGKMTLAYGAAQVVAPALTGVLAQHFGNYHLGLFFAAGFVVLGALLVAMLKRVPQYA
ncbi:MAG: YbfB/YjiJ family MFS transporter [Pontibacterium sp.]